MASVLIKPKTAFAKGDGHQPSTAGHAINPGKAQVLRELAHSIQAIETTATSRGNVVSTGCEFLDSELPGGGFHPGSIIEWLMTSRGDGSLTLALQATKAAMGESKHAVIIDQQRCFYPLAAQALGIDLQRLVILHPTNKADAMWSFDQSLRCPAVAAVIAWQDHIDEINARRLQLAAEQGNTLGLLLRRNVRSHGQTHWADMTWQVTPLPAALSKTFSGPPSLPQTTARPAKPSSSSLRFVSQRPAGVPPYSDNYRWLHLQLKRMRAGRGKSSMASQIAAGDTSYLVAINGHDGHIYAQRHMPFNLPEVQHESSSALHLAAELALPARRSRNANGSHRAAHAG